MGRGAVCLTLGVASALTAAPPHLVRRRVARQAVEEEVDVAVIGSGLAGLSCAALLASRGRKVAVFEAHYELGGCAHEWAVGMDGRTIPSARLEAMAERPPVFKFEAGPSLYSGLSPAASPNPLKHVYQMIGEEPEWITYDRWGAYLPEAPEGYELSIGAANFYEILKRYGGPTATRDWDRLAATLRPLAKGVMGLPSVAVRGDAGVVATLVLRYPGAFFRVLGDVGTILKPFDMESEASPFYVEDPFLRNYLDLIAFLLQGLPANQTLTAVMAYMVEDFYRVGAVMDFPKGGSKALVDALVRAIEKHGGAVHRSTPVRRVLVQGGAAVGVELKSSKGGVVKAKKAVISNADLAGTFKLVDRGASKAFDEERDRLLRDVPLCKSFMHVHLGIRLDDATAAKLPPQWTVCASWDNGIDAPANVIVVSLPSLLDRSMAPDGYHTIHAYTAGNEPWDLWARFDDDDDDDDSSSTAEGRRKTTRDPAYAALKRERSQPIFNAIQRKIPDLRDRIVVEQVATPITHKRFLRRERGNYGPAIAAGNDLGLEFPSVKTPLKNYLRCGDSTTAGIGVPAVASSGAQCANALLAPWEQVDMNSKIRM